VTHRYDFMGASYGLRRTLYVAVPLVAIAVLAALFFLLQDGSSTDTGATGSLNFADVVITDLIQEEIFDGTLGSIDDDPITAQIGGTITEIPAPGDTIIQGEPLFLISGQPVVLLYGDLPSYRDIAIGEDTITVSSQLQGTVTSVAEPGRIIQQGDVLYTVDGQPVVALYGDLPSYRDIAIGEDSIVVSSQLQGTITSVAEPGEILVQGDALYSVDGRPTVILYGDAPTFRDIRAVQEPTIVSSQLQGAITSVAQPGAVIQQGDTLYSVDGQPVVMLYGQVPAFRDIVMAEQPTVVSSQLQGTITSIAEPGAVVQQGDVLYSVDTRPIVVLYGDVPAFRTIATSEDSIVVSSQLQGTITSMVESGAVVQQGDVLYRVDGQPVVVLYGEQPFFRPLADTAPALTSALDVVSFAERDLEAAVSALDDVSNSDAMLELGSALEEAETAYRQELTRWFGSAVADELGDLPPQEILAAWGVTYSEIFDADITVAGIFEPESSATDDPLTPWDELTVFATIMFSPFAIYTGDNPEQFAVDSSDDAPPFDDLIYAVSPQWELEDAWSTSMAARDQLDAQGVLDAAAVLAAEKAISNAEVGVSEAITALAQVQNTTGADVLQLETALVALGYGDALVADGTYTAETTRAVLSFQAAYGLDRDGVVNHGEVFFVSGPAQVLQRLATPGDLASGAVLSLSAGNPTTGPDVLQLEAALLALGYDAEGTLVVDGIHNPETTAAVIAFQAANGLDQDGVVDLGEVIFLPGPAQVLAHIAAPGDQSGGGVVSVATGDKITGPDVLQLEQALIALGYDAEGSLVADGTYSPETAKAVLAFQAATGLEQDGVVNLGEVVFLSGPAQVLNSIAAPGDQSGGEILSLAVGDPTSGTDVLQLEKALLALGFDAEGTLIADGIHTPETTQAVLAFQESNGLHQDGVVDLGEVIFLPGPAQVLEYLAMPGDPAGGSIVRLATGDPTTGPDVLQLEQSLVALGYDLVADGTYDSETTEAVIAFQADNGLDQDGIVNLGDVVFLPGPAQVLQHLAVPGNQVGGAVLSIAAGKPTTGVDVLQLEEALVALGYDAGGALIADGTYTAMTTQAVLAFQTAVGLEPDGIVHQGEIVFLPGSVRVTDQLATSGSGVGPGSTVLGISLSPKVVRIDLPANKQGSLAAGNTVIVELPDFTEVPATVLSVSETAKSSQFGGATFDVVVELDDAGPAAGLDEAPVDVIAVSDSVENVMAIPVSALVALLEGGFAVELDTGGGATQFVAVEVGFFGENGMIEITSATLQTGDRVVVP
jgi:peptidoglycan hydrolase-like protein with peptidoglycan-binding domain